MIQSWNRLFDVDLPNNNKLVHPKDINNCSGSAAVHDIQMSQLPRDSYKLLTDQIEMFT